MNKKEHTIDATGQSLGRLASQIASLLRGKNDAAFAFHQDLVGGQVIVTNIAKMKVTGKKMEQKKYRRYSGYPGGLKSTLMKNISPARRLRLAIQGMLPKNRLQKTFLKKLTIREE